MRRMFFALALLGGLMLTLRATAVETDPSKDYTITPAAGQWLICAASYTGPQAARDAHDLVLDIRRRFNLPAFVYNRSDKERQQQDQERKRLKDRCPEGHFRTVRIEDQYAVLVGGYKDIETARRALNEIKKLEPSEKRLMRVAFASAVPGPDGKEKRDADAPKMGYVSPFMDAFVVPNPAAPPERKVEKKPDTLLRKLNENEDYSLLKCRAPWTLAVANFPGITVIQSQSQAESSSFLVKLFGSGSGEVLAASGLNAHNLAEALRKMNYEAYVLHTKNSSVVSVGSFRSADDPALRQMQQAIMNNLQLNRQQLQMLSQPMPMEVPRL